MARAVLVVDERVGADDVAARDGRPLRARGVEVHRAVRVAVGGEARVGAGDLPDLRDGPQTVEAAKAEV